MKKLFFLLSFTCLSTISSYAKEQVILQEESHTLSGTLSCGRWYHIVAPTVTEAIAAYRLLECLECQKCQEEEGELNN